MQADSKAIDKPAGALMKDDGATVDYNFYSVDAHDRRNVAR